MKVYSISSINSAGNSQYSPAKKRTGFNSVSNTDSVSFGMRVNYGVPASLPDIMQKKVANIHSNIDFIQEFFAEYTRKNPTLSAKIKKLYTDIIPQRKSAILFKLPDTDNTLEVMKGQTRSNILYISINDDSHLYNGIIVDGKDKLIANYLKKHPHMLPAGIKYMNAEAMQKAEPEKFINLADEKLQNYSDFIRKIKNGEIPLSKQEQSQANKPLKTKSKNETERNITKANKNSKTDKKQEKTTLTKIIDRRPEAKPVHKPPKLTNEEFSNYITAKSENILKQISSMLNQDSFPEHITPIRTKNGNALGIKLNTDDGGSLKVVRKAIGSYGSSMPYLSFEKINKDNTSNYISIDFISNKILRTKEKGKPHISADHVVYELTPDELKRRNIETKLDYYMSQIFKENTVKNNSIRDIPEQSFPQNAEKIVKEFRALGEKDGKIAAEEYFKAFKTKFTMELQAKMNEFSENTKNFIALLNK